jgi:hypothetical protein
MLVLPSKSAQVWDKFIKENQVLVYKYIVRTIRNGLRTDNDRIDLFKFEDNTMFAWVPRNKALITLEDALQIFIKAEEYEYAEKTKNLITKYHIDNLIKESNKPED